MSLMIGEQMQPVVSPLLLLHLVDEVIPLVALKADKIYVDSLIILQVIIFQVHRSSPPHLFLSWKILPGGRREYSSRVPE